MGIFFHWLSRESGSKGVREREKYLLVASSTCSFHGWLGIKLQPNYVPLTRNQTGDSSACRPMLQPTEPPLPGLTMTFFETLLRWKQCRILRRWPHQGISKVLVWAWLGQSTSLCNLDRSCCLLGFSLLIYKMMVLCDFMWFCTTGHLQPRFSSSQLRSYVVTLQ